MIGGEGGKLFALVAAESREPELDSWLSRLEIKVRVLLADNPPPVTAVTWCRCCGFGTCMVDSVGGDA